MSDTQGTETDLKKAVENLGGTIQRIDYKALGTNITNTAANALTDLSNGTAEVLEQLKPEDITGENLRQAFNDNGGITGLTSYLVGFNANLTIDTVSTLFNAAGGDFNKLAQNLIGPKPDKPPAQAPAQQKEFGLMAMLGIFTGDAKITDFLPDGFGLDKISDVLKKILSFIPGVDSSMFDGLISSVKSVIPGLGGDTAGAEQVSTIEKGALGDLFSIANALEDASLIQQVKSLGQSVTSGSLDLNNDFRTSVAGITAVDISNQSELAREVTKAFTDNPNDQQAVFEQIVALKPQLAGLNA